MKSINHAALRQGDRIVEGHGKNARTIPVQRIERYPESMCRGTHVYSPVLKVNGHPVVNCYTENVVIK